MYIVAGWLHWLLIKFYAYFKILLVSYKTLNWLSPYLLINSITLL